MMKFPKTIYVKFEEEGTDEEWMNASEDGERLAEKGKSIRVGRYELFEVMGAQNRTVLVNAR